MRRINRKPEFWFVILLLVISYFVFVVFKDLRELGTLDRERTGLQESLKKETVLRKELEVQSQSLKQSGRLEIAARQKLGMIKKGETPFKIIIVK